MCRLSFFALVSLTLVYSVRIGKVSHARIANTTSLMQSSCSSCLCQCFTPNSSSLLCCQVNCFEMNNTCQVIHSSSKTVSTIILDTSSTIYLVRCSTYSTFANTQPTTQAMTTQRSIVTASGAKTSMNTATTSRRVSGSGSGFFPSFPWR